MVSNAGLADGLDLTPNPDRMDPKDRIRGLLTLALTSGRCSQQLITQGGDGK